MGNSKIVSHCKMLNTLRDEIKTDAFQKKRRRRKNEENDEYVYGCFVCEHVCVYELQCTCRWNVCVKTCGTSSKTESVNCDEKSQSYREKRCGNLEEFTHSFLSFSLFLSIYIFLKKKKKMYNTTF